MAAGRLGGRIEAKIEAMRRYGGITRFSGGERKRCTVDSGRWKNITVSYAENAAWVSGQMAVVIKNR